jgi:hypothetical protein
VHLSVLEKVTPFWEPKDWATKIWNESLNFGVGPEILGSEQRAFSWNLTFRRRDPCHVK